MAVPNRAKEVTDSIAEFVDAVNRGDQAEAVGRLSADVTIIEDLAPFRWHGRHAGPEWMLAMWGQRKNMTAITMKITQPTRVEVEGSAAYAVVPGLLTFVGPGSTLHSDGLLTFSLRLSDGRWLINGLVWSGPTAS